VNGLRVGHPSDERLQAPGDARAVAHVRSCSACRERVVELSQVRRALRDAGGREDVPRSGVVRGAVARLRMRRTAISTTNEIFEALVAIVRGLTSLGSPERGRHHGEELQDDG